MRTVIRRFDGWLREISDVFEFTSDPKCILRLQFSRAPEALQFPNQIVNTNAPVVLLHLWNEHLLPISTGGPNLAWAKTMQREFIYSLGLVGKLLKYDPRYTDVQAVGAETILALSGNQDAGGKLLHHLNFTVWPTHNRLGRFGEFWENLYSYALIWTFNPQSLHSHAFWRLRRTQAWMPTETFIEQFASE
jgi:hypothetical protein